MRHHILVILVGVVACCHAVSASAAVPAASAADAALADSIMQVLKSREYAGTGARIAAAAEALTGAGSDPYYQTDSVATLRVNMTGFNPMTFVNTTLALALTAGGNEGGFPAFGERLQNLSCRRGESDGFASILWHAADWIGDNSYRGNIQELTDRYGDGRSKTKSLDYISRNREKFAVLKDEAVYDKVKMTEMGFRTHRIPYLPKQFAGNKAFLEDLRDGDILVLVPYADGSDIYRIGFVKIEDGTPYFIHYDTRSGRVVREHEPLKRYFNLVSKHFIGFRWLRVKE